MSITYFKQLRSRLDDVVANTNSVFSTEETAGVSASTTTNGEWIAIDLGDLRRGVDVVATVSGAATLTIELSEDGTFTGEEHTARDITYDEAGTNVEQFDFAYQHVRVSVDANLTELEIISRGS